MSYNIISTYVGKIISPAALCIGLTGVAHADPRALQVYASELGFKAPIEAFRAIDTASKTYSMDPQKLVRIAIVESSINHRAINTNMNGTKDIGLFQINTVIVNTDCVEFNIYNIQGNALCAAKLLLHHKVYAKTDSDWIGRFHSKNPIKKAAYVRRLANIEQPLIKVPVVFVVVKHLSD